MDNLKPSGAFVGTKYVGTNRLGRPLTAAEAKDLASLLRKHDFVGASLVSLKYAYKRSRNGAAAQELRDRAHRRLVEQGWDPGVVSLVRCLCRFVRSEHGNATRKEAVARKHEEVWLHQEADAAPSAEVLAENLRVRRQEEACVSRRIASLRESFVKAGDEVNILWLGFQLDGVDRPSEMARSSGRNVREFYRATDRRRRHIDQLLAADGGATIEENE